MSHAVRRLRRRAAGQRGASYSLPVVLTAPFYLMLVLLVFELTFLLVARAGTQYAAFAAARAAAVWHHAKHEPAAELRPKQAAWAHLAPFVTGRQRELDAAGPVPAEARELAPDYAAAVRRFMTPAGAAESRAPDAAFLERKVLNAAARAEVLVEPLGEDGPHRLVRVTVTFRAPLHMPVVSRFLDPDGTAPFEYPLRAAVTLTAEGPETESGTFGIDHVSDRTPKKQEKGR